MILLIPFFILMEIVLSFYFIDHIGFWLSIAWVLITFFIGFFMLRLSSLAFSNAVQSIDITSVHKIHLVQQKSTAYMFGALMLMIPGLFTDILGVLSILYVFYLQIADKIAPKEDNYKKGEEDVIDVEVIERTHDSDAQQ
ncbi:MAG: FxsA family protein [Campylobacterales bacterium]|nr:FxsA family protein [Campylobacterales bacterium]